MTYKCATCGSTDLSLKLKWNNYCRPCYAAYARGRRVTKRGKHRCYWLKRMVKVKYGLTIDQYMEAFRAQDGKCKVCHRSTKLVVDHRHTCCPMLPTCGKCFRGLICTNCNLAIGHLKESSKLAAELAVYLEL